VEKPEADDLADLLSVERFPEWRARFFKDIHTGKPYETPLHQHAWFAVMAGLAQKQAIPEWALAFFDRYQHSIPDDINDKITSGEYLISWVNLGPPRHGKTDLAIHGETNLICANRNMRIIHCAGIVGTSSQAVNNVKNVLEFDETMIEAYGQFHDDAVKPWADGEFTVAGRAGIAKAPTMAAIGLGGNPLSKDADLIVIDDPQSLDAALSQAQTLRDYKFLTTQLMTRREPHTALIGFGSFQPSPTGDLWWELKQHVEDLSEGRHVVVLTEVKAHNYDWCNPEDPEHTRCLLWPTIRPFWFLQAQRAALGDADYESIYNQEPRHGQISYFRNEIVRGDFEQPVWDGDPSRPSPDPESKGILDIRRSFGQIPSCCGRKVLVGMGFDPAAGESKDASETALAVVGGCSMCDRRYLIETWAAKQSPEKHPETIGDFARLTHPSKVKVEINAYQKALARDPRLLKIAQEVGFVLDEWMTDDRKNDPMLGIPVLSRHMESGKFSVPYSFQQDREKAEPFLRALLRWPKKPNDRPMALWLADLAVSELIELSRHITSDRMPGWNRLSRHIKSTVVKVPLSV